MKKLTLGIFSLLLVTVVAMPLGAQEVTCDDIAFDERVVIAYPAAREACLEVVEDEGVKYAHFMAMVHEGPPSMLLRFKHRDESWGPATRITPRPGFTVYLDGMVLPVEDIKRGREISIYLPEGRWELAIADADELAIAEAEFAPIEFEVTDLELPDEVDMEAANVDEAAQETPADDSYQAADDTEEEYAAEDDGDSQWLWILGLAGAFIIVWFLLRRRKARREE